MKTSTDVAEFIFLCSIPFVVRLSVNYVMTQIFFQLGVRVGDYYVLKVWEPCRESDVAMYGSMFRKVLLWPPTRLVLPKPVDPLHSAC